jgi:ABC-2 type transport system permease protein
MHVLAKQITYLLPLPVHPETMTGYLQWRVFGAMPLIVGFWAVLSATGAVRGEEERGLTETWLSAGVPRSRLIFIRLGGFAIVAAIVSGLTALACAAVAAGMGTALPLGRLLLEAVALTVLTITCFSIVLLIAQGAARRINAAAWASVVLLALFLLDSLSRTAAHPGPYRWLSPFYYYDRSDALAPGGQLDVTATASLVAIAVLAGLLAAVAFRQRDLGAALLARRPTRAAAVHTPETSPLWRLPVLPAIYEQRLGLLAWIAGTAILTAFMVSLAKQGVDALRGLPTMRQFLVALGGGSLDRAFIGAFWFETFQLVLAAYAITQVSRWAADDAEGRLELALSEPIHRWRVVIERAVTLALSGTLIITASGLVVLAIASATNVTLSLQDDLRASLPLIPFTLAFGAVGAALTGRIPRATVAVLSIVAVAGYFVEQLGPLLKWPDWLDYLSAFHLYGTPLTKGVFWSGLWAMIAVTLAGFAVALWTMERREVGR